MDQSGWRVYESYKIKLDFEKIETLPNDWTYYSVENSFIIDYYYYITAGCQGSAFLCGVLYSYTDYRKWIFWGSGMAMLCLPVDVLIFYKEPLGMIGKYSRY